MDEITSSDLLYDAGNAKPGQRSLEKAGGGGDGQRARSSTISASCGITVSGLNLTIVPTVYGLEQRDGLQAGLTFTLPLATPQPIAGQTFTFAYLRPDLLRRYDL
ncbi:hypothetical protein MJK72_21450 [Klebsiella pneumoniae]|nr:hypothetical protein MJK72_21450 [Klebsiella pneumoniae]